MWWASRYQQVDILIELSCAIWEGIMLHFIKRIQRAIVHVRTVAGICGQLILLFV